MTDQPNPPLSAPADVVTDRIIATNDWLEDKASFEMEDRRENQHCPCGNQIIREGKVVMAHWSGKVCQECEATMFEKNRLRADAFTPSTPPKLTLCRKCGYPEEDHDGTTHDFYGPHDHLWFAELPPAPATSLPANETPTSPTVDGVLDLLDELQEAARDFDHPCCKKGNCPHEKREITARLAVLQHCSRLAAPPSSLPSNVKEAIEELLDEMRDAYAGYFSWTPTTSPPDWASEIKPLEERVITARSNLESLFLKQQQEIERLKAKSESVGVDRESSTASTTDPHTTK